MIVDTSAILAVLFNEPDAGHFTRAIAESPLCRMSTANFMEATLVVEGRTGMAGGHELDLFIERAAIELVPVSVEHAQALLVWLLGASSAEGTPCALNFVMFRLRSY